jgi:uncharacterized protein YoxC
VPRALQELAEAQKRTELGLQRLEQLTADLMLGQTELRKDVDILKQDVSVLKQDVGVLKQDVDILKQDVGVLKQDLGVLKQDVGVLKQDVAGLNGKVDRLDQNYHTLQRDVSKLKGKAQEDCYRSRASAIFGHFLHNGRDVTNWVADQLYEALDQQLVTHDEVTAVLSADLLWGGEEGQSKAQLVLVMEASWLAEAQDVVRAQERAKVLRRIGLQALAVVGSDEWESAATVLAREANIVITVDGQLSLDSWQRAWRALQEPQSAPN